MDEYTTGSVSTYQSGFLTTDESRLTTEVAHGENEDDSWRPVFMIACCLLLFGLIFICIFVSLQIFFDDTLEDDDEGDDDKHTYATSGRSGGSGSGGDPKTTTELQVEPLPKLSLHQKDFKISIRK
ncbi:hypothetical protein MTO96_017739 [Rhipicephalus appendiculatus]